MTDARSAALNYVEQHRFEFEEALKKLVTIPPSRPIQSIGRYAHRRKLVTK